MGHEYDMATIEDDYEDSRSVKGCGKFEDDCICNFSDCNGCPLAPTDSKNCLAERKTEGLSKATVTQLITYKVTKGH